MQCQQVFIVTCDILHGWFEILFRLRIGLNTFKFSFSTLFSWHRNLGLHTFQSNKSSLGVTFGSHSLDSTKFILRVLRRGIKSIIRILISFGFESICIPQGVNRMVSRFLSWTHTSNHYDLVLLVHLNEGVSQDQSEFALSEWDMASLLAHGSYTFL